MTCITVPVTWSNTEPCCCTVHLFAPVQLPLPSMAVQTHNIHRASSHGSTTVTWCSKHIISIWKLVLQLSLCLTDLSDLGLRPPLSSQFNLESIKLIFYQGVPEILCSREWDGLTYRCRCKETDRCTERKPTHNAPSHSSCLCRCDYSETLPGWRIFSQNKSITLHLYLYIYTHVLNQNKTISFKR